MRPSILRTALAAVCLSFFAGGLTAAPLPAGVQLLDTGFDAPAITNMSNRYVQLGGISLGAPGSGGLYETGGVVDGSMSQVWSFDEYTQLGCDTCSYFGLYRLPDGRYMLPWVIAGDHVYGYVDTLANMDGNVGLGDRNWARCDIGVTVAGQPGSCEDFATNVQISTQFAPLVGADAASEQGVLFLMQLLAADTNDNNVMGFMPGADLPFFAGDAGSVIWDVRENVALVDDRQSPRNFRLVTWTGDGSDAQALPLVDSADVPLPQEMFAVTVSDVGAGYLSNPAADVRVLFFEAVAGSQSQATGDIYMADFQLDTVAGVARQVTAMTRLTGDDPLEKAEGTGGQARLRLTEQGLAYANVYNGDDVNGNSTSTVAIINTTVYPEGGNLPGSGALPAGAMTRLADIDPLAAGFYTAESIATSVCGSSVIMTLNDQDEPVGAYLLTNDDCPQEAMGANAVTVLPEATLIDPAETTMLSVDVRLSSSAIYGIELTCSADPSVLTLTGGQLGDLFGNEALVVGPTMDGNSWTVAVARSGTDEPLQANGVFATLQYAVQFTTAETAINCTADASDSDGLGVGVQVNNATVTVDDGIHGGSGSLSGQVTLPVGSDHSGIEVTVHRNGNSYTTTTDVNGNYVFTDLRDGVFSLTFSSERYVSDCVQASVAGGASVTLSPRVMIAGDINDDDMIDIGDFTLMAGAYGASDGDAGFVPEADLNADGTIGIRDLSILGSHFGLNMCNPEDLISACGFDALDSGFIIDAPGTAISLEGMAATVTAEDDAVTPELEAFIQDIPSAVSGSTYIEYTYTGATAVDADAMAVFGFLNSPSASSNGVGIGISPATSSVVSMSGTPLFSGVAISPGYTVGASFNHETGVVQVQDSLGNSTFFAAEVDITNVPVYAGIGGQPAAGAGNQLTGTLSVNSGSYVLQPFAGSQDWCGNPL